MVLGMTYAGDDNVMIDKVEYLEERDKEGLEEVRKKYEATDRNVISSRYYLLM